MDNDLFGVPDHGCRTAAGADAGAEDSRGGILAKSFLWERQISGKASGLINTLGEHR
jgi:hypothetical protein